MNLLFHMDLSQTEIEKHEPNLQEEVNNYKNGKKKENELSEFIKKHYPYSIVTQDVNVCNQFSLVKRHRLDIFVTLPDGRRIAVSVKNQDTGGTAEEKVPYELGKLGDMLTKRPDIESTYLVICGNGWSCKEMYLGEEGYWPKHFRVNYPQVKIICEHTFKELVENNNL